MGIWIADEREGLLRPGKAPVPCQPQCLCVCGDSVVCATAAGAVAFALEDGRELCRFPLPPGVRCLRALPGALYCLSGEADSVSLLCPRTGQLRLCARAGCDPRDLAFGPGCRVLAAAGGAAGQLYLLDSADLHLLRSIALPGVVYAVCFCGAELMALCAVEAGDIQAGLYRISVRGVVTELLRLPGLPGGLLALPGGGLLVGALGQLLQLRPGGGVQRRAPCALPARLRLYGDCVLCVDSLDGTLLRFSLRDGRPVPLYRGAPVDALIV